MSATTKILLALLGVTVVTAGGASVYHFGSWEVKKSMHKGWSWRVVKHRGEYTTYASQPGFGEGQVGEYATKPAAMEAAILYIDSKTGTTGTAGIEPPKHATLDLSGVAGQDQSAFGG